MDRDMHLPAPATSSSGSIADAPMAKDKDTHWDLAAHWVAQAMGLPATFFLAFAAVVAWVATGPVMKFDNTWWLWMSTGASVIAYLMVFVLQTSANRESRILDRQLTEIRAQMDRMERVLMLRKMQRPGHGHPENRELPFGTKAPPTMERSSTQLSGATCNACGFDEKTAGVETQ